MDQIDLMDKTDCSAFLSPCGPSGPLKTLFTHLITGASPSFDFSGFSACFCYKMSENLFFDRAAPICPYRVIKAPCFFS